MTQEQWNEKFNKALRMMIAHQREAKLFAEELMALSRVQVDDEDLEERRAKVLRMIDRTQSQEPNLKKLKV